MNITKTTSCHHEQTKSVQVTFQKSANDLVSTIEELGNPFSYTSDTLLVLYTRYVVDPKVATRLKELHLKGLSQYKAFVHERFLIQLNETSFLCSADQ